MMASETVSTMASDPVLNIFKTFTQINNHSLKTFFAVASKSNFNEEIMSASSTLACNFVIFPIEYSPTTYPKGWAQKLSLEMFASNNCPVAFFIDRGFGISSGSGYDNFASLRDRESAQIEVALSEFSAVKPPSIRTNDSASAVDLPGTEPKKQAIFFAFDGGKDDIDVCVLLNYLSHNPLVTIEIMVTFEVETGSDAAVCLEALKSFPTVIINIDLSGDITTRASKLGPKDLVLVSHSTYSSETTFQNWLDTECVSSFCIVKAAEVDSKKIIVQA